MRTAPPIRELDRREIWNAGVTLWAAQFRLAPNADLADYSNKHAMRRPFTDVVEGWIAQLSKLPAAEQSAAMAKYNAWAKANSDADAAQSKLQRFLIDHLRAGNLIALGYSVPRHANDDPIPIPQDVWEGRIDWANSTVKGNRLEFVAIRILARNWIDNIEAQKASAAARALPAPKPRGRKPIKVAVPEAFQQLLDAGKIELNKPKSHCYDAIRNLLARKYPDREDEFRRMSNDTISRGISPLIRRLPPRSHSIPYTHAPRLTKHPFRKTRELSSACIAIYSCFLTHILALRPHQGHWPPSRPPGIYPFCSLHQLFAQMNHHQPYS
jgi:hypothetical protein